MGTNVSNIIIVCENRAFINDTTCPRVLLNITSFEWATNGTVLYKGGAFGVKQVLQRSGFFFSMVGNLLMVFLSDSLIFCGRKSERGIARKTERTAPVALLS